MSKENTDLLLLTPKIFHVFTDCGLRFPMESEETPLKLLADRDEMVINIPPRNCSINASSCMYLDCQTWRPIDKMIVIDKFRLTHRKMDNHILKVSFLLILQPSR